MTIQQILIKYWGYSSFRPLQEDIINSVIKGRDTLALLPTGGGKSICFQVPALAKEGLCIVISPLIALMKDQVENLRKKGINAVAIYSGMHKNETDIVLDNCAYGNVKLLYVSPERLATELFTTRLRKMKVNLIAVDEAHCISQWGYDFRPPYLEISKIREITPGVPVLALTATATYNVVEDIQDKLQFKEKNVFKKSFERKNLTYNVIEEEDKLKKLLKLVNYMKGTGIIYTRSRRKTVEISTFLNKNNISSDYYHAGLAPEIRHSRQNAWMSEKRRIIVSTNAFGMGIDKPNVRFVIHFDIPDSIEAYFQEAGRAGRDEKDSTAILLYSNSDIIELKKNISLSFPETEQIRNVYQLLGNYLQLAVGSGRDESFDFDITDFANNYNLKPLTAYNCLKFLEKEGYISITEALSNPSRIYFKMKKDELYQFQVANIYYDNFIKVILRSYTGLFNDFVRISESELAKRAGISKEEVVKHLKKLETLNVLTYIAQSDKPRLTFCREKLDAKDIYISKSVYKERKEVAVIKTDAIINYGTKNNKCRSQMLLAYFGERDSKRCGKCDVCLKRNELELSELEFDIVLNQIKPLLTKSAYTIEEIINEVENVNENKIIKVIQWLMDKRKVVYNSNNKLTWLR